MAGKTAILAIKVVSDASQAPKGFDQAGSSAEKFANRAKAASRVAGIGIAAVGVAAFKQASALQQSSGAVTAVFGKQDAAVKKLAKGAADSLGLARSEYEQTAAVFGSQLKNMGVSSGQLVPTTDKLIKLGGDLAATYGGSTSKAVEALGSLMRGETDPIEAYGVGIKQADINARLASKGQDKLTGAAAKTAKTEATLALLYEQTAAAQGQRTREQGSAAQAQEVAMAKIKNAGAALGTVLLPVVAAIAAAFATMAGFVEKNKDVILPLVGVLVVLAATVYAVNVAYAAYTAVSKAITVVTKAQTAGQLSLNAAMRANPIGVVVTAILLLVAGVVLAYKKSETFRTVVQVAMSLARTAVDKVVTGVKNVVDWFGKVGTKAKEIFEVGVKKSLEVITTPIDKLLQLIKDVVAWIARIKFPSPPKWLGSIVSKVTSVGGGDSDPGFERASTTSATASLGGDTYVFNFPGGVVASESQLADLVINALKNHSSNRGIAVFG